MKGYLTSTEVAKILGVGHPRKVSRWAKEGKFTSVIKVGGIYLISEKEIKTFKIPKRGRPRNEKTKSTPTKSA